MDIVEQAYHRGVLDALDSVVESLSAPKLADVMIEELAARGLDRATVSTAVLSVLATLSVSLQGLGGSIGESDPPAELPET